MTKLTRGSLRILRRHVRSAQRPRARWRAMVRLVARERGWSNATAFLGARYDLACELLELGMLPSPFMKLIQRSAAHAG